MAEESLMHVTWHNAGDFRYVGYDQRHTATLMTAKNRHEEVYLQDLRLARLQPGRTVHAVLQTKHGLSHCHCRKIDLMHAAVYVLHAVEVLSQLSVSDHEAARIYPAQLIYT